MKHIDTWEEKKLIDNAKMTKAGIRRVAMRALLAIDYYQSEEIQNKINNFGASESAVERLQHENKVLIEEKSAAHKSIGIRAKIIEEQNTTINLLRAAVGIQGGILAAEIGQNAKTWGDTITELNKMDRKDTVSSEGVTMEWRTKP